MTNSRFHLALSLVGMLICRTGFAIEPVVVGEPQQIFVWASDRCDSKDIPDAPARAFRDAEGTVHLLAAHDVNRTFAGAQLGAVEHDCGVVFQGGGRDEPAAFDDRIWLASVWTADGTVVHALGHAEYHGHLRPSICPAGRYMACWWNAVVQLVSTDGGKTFRRAGEAGRGLVAALPYRYDPSLGRPAGYFSPSNIIERDGYWYVFVFAESYGAQRRGACLLRTDRLDDPSSWRAWDGSGFTISFADPYTDDTSRPEDHVCAPVPGVSSTISSASRLGASGPYLALIAASRPAVPGGKPVAGIYSMSSSDLIRWTEPRLLLAVPIMFAFSCDARAVYGYPSLLDAQSPSRTFEAVEKDAFLYLTRINVHDCRLSMERDLVRFPVALEDPKPVPASSR
jgi:hypothetical protein